MFAHDIDNPDLALQALFDGWPGVTAVFLLHRLLCVGCPIAPFHTVNDACLEYNLDELGFRREMRAVVPPTER